MVTLHIKISPDLNKEKNREKKSVKLINYNTKECKKNFTKLLILNFNFQTSRNHCMPFFRNLAKFLILWH